MCASMNFQPDILKQCWFLAGPTAVGKSKVSLELAQRLNAEVISMDSMAIYRRMDVGTAKPSAAEQAVVRHHLIDVIDPDQEYSVADYVHHARSAAEDILARQKVPLFVGGTGLYLRSILRGVFQGPEADWDLRRDLERVISERGVNFLHDELRSIDPVTAERLHPNDTRRVIRAMEVFRATGQPLSTLHGEQALPAKERPDKVFWLEPQRDWLHQRVNQRVDQMMSDGLLEETRQLLQQEPPPGRTARQAIGYRELIEHLERNLPLVEAIEQIKTVTRQFAKRQHTWFRNLEECRALSVCPHDSATVIVEKLIQVGCTGRHS